MKRENLIRTTVGVIILTLSACNGQRNSSQSQVDSLSVEDTTLYHGYNELANPDKRESFTISDFNSDNEEIANIDRPSKSVVSTGIDTTLLFTIWTSDPDGPHADFEFSSKSFYVVDYDGDGDMPYFLTDKKLKIYYNDFIQEGEIVSVDKDTLKIKWADFDKANSYVRWTN